MSNGPNGGQATGTAASPSSLPDINNQTYPFDVVLYQLNQAASFNMFATPVEKRSDVSNTDDAFGVNGGFVLDIHSNLHRFESVVQPITPESRLKVRQKFGEPTGTFHCRLMVSPDDFQWSPGLEPSPILFDPTVAQRFVMLDNEFNFGDGTDGFRGYAVGRTFPLTVNGRSRLLAGAVGNIMEGFGRITGLEGTYLFTGTITPGFGLLGDITLRVVDWSGNLRTESEISSLSPISNPDPEATYIVLRGQKKDAAQRSEYSFSPDGRVQGLMTPAQWRSARYDFTTRGRKGLRGEVTVGQIIGSLDATIMADLFGPPGTAANPGDFTTQELYTFVDENGETIGTITAGVVLGESFDLKFPALPGQPGLRFGGFGLIQGGTGYFSGVRGMLTVNSLIGIMPHALSLMHVFRIIDPRHKYRDG
jgi:hypothetical protein